MRSYVVDLVALERLRTERGMSVIDLRRATGLSRTYVGYVRAGKRNLTATTGKLFADALGVPLSAFATPRVDSSQDSSRGQSSTAA